jgi:hypothetical protein
MIINAGVSQKKFTCRKSKTGIQSWPKGVDGNLVVASHSTASWNRHAAALNSYTKFLLESGHMIS